MDGHVHNGLADSFQVIQKRGACMVCKKSQGWPWFIQESRSKGWPQKDYMNIKDKWCNESVGPEQG